MQLPTKDMIFMAISEKLNTIQGFFEFSEFYKPNYTVSSDEDRTAHSNAIWRVHWTKSGKLLYGSIDGAVFSWNYPQKSIYTYDRHGLGVTSISSDSSGNIGLSCSQDGSIHILDLLSGNIIGFINAGPFEAWTAVFSPDDSCVLSGTFAGQIHIWNSRSGLLQSTIETHSQFQTSLQFSPISNDLCTGGSDGVVHIIDYPSQTVKQSIEVHSLPITDLCHSSDGFMLLTSSNDCRIKVLSVSNDYSVIYSFSCHSSPVRSVCAFSLPSLSSSSSFCCSASSDSIMISNLASRNTIQDSKLVRKDDDDDEYCGLSVSCDGKFLAIAFASGLVEVHLLEFN